MYQSIPAVPPPPPPRATAGHLLKLSVPGWGIRNFIAAWGLGISVPLGDPRAFDTRVFQLTWKSLSEKTRPSLKTGLSMGVGGGGLTQGNLTFSWKLASNFPPLGTYKLSNSPPPGTIGSHSCPGVTFFSLDSHFSNINECSSLSISNSLLTADGNLSCNTKPFRCSQYRTRP